MRKLTLITLGLIFCGSTAAFACGDGWVQIPNSNACMRTDANVATAEQGENRSATFFSNEVQGADVGEGPHRGRGVLNGDAVEGSVFGF